MSFKVRLFNLFRKIFQAPSLESWLVRRTRGRSASHFFSKLVPNPYQYKVPCHRTFSREGIILSVDLSDYIGHFYYFGFQDPSLEKLYELCREDAVVLDIGCNIGFTALKLAQKAKAGSVICFEPDPFNYACCRKNLELNRFHNIRALNVALGNDTGKVQMELRTPANRGGNRINQSSARGLPVDIRRLDDLIGELMVDRVDLIKIDVEGYELKVMEGAEQTIRAFKPILFIELDDNNLKDQADSAGELIAFLVRTGYEHIVRSDSGHAIDTTYDFSKCHFDVIAR